jgi:hypothetical protein
MDPLLTSLMRRASYKSEMPRLELKSWRTFLAIKCCQRTKIRKVFKLARSSKKSGRRYATIAVKLLTTISDRYYLEPSFWLIHVGSMSFRLSVDFELAGSPALPWEMVN